MRTITKPAIRPDQSDGDDGPPGTDVAGPRRTARRASLMLAGLAAAVFLFPGQAAAVKFNACQIKHSYCSERCLMRADTGPAGTNCIRRTCDRQHRGCGPESIGKGNAGLVTPKPASSGTGGTAGSKTNPGPIDSGPGGPRPKTGPLETGPLGNGPFGPKTGPIVKPIRDHGGGTTVGGQTKFGSQAGGFGRAASSGSRVR
jgi:hypothetical protein